MSYESMTYEKLKEALMAYCCDASRTTAEIKAGLEALIEEAKIIADTIDK